VFAGLQTVDFGYRVLYLLHILLIIVGFGTSFAYPALASRARQLPPAEGHAIGHASLAISKGLTTYPIWAAGAVGIILVAVSESWEFSQAWVSIAFVLFFGAVLFAWFVHMPNLRKLDALQEEVLAGPPSQGAPPPQIAEIQERGKRAGMYGGLLHLAFLLLVIDMIWKPGFP
jgi:HAMP domain-containing protein